MQRVLTDEKMMYDACPVCRKKVQDEAAGYKCESCSKIYGTMVPTYMLAAKISDLSGSIYIQFPRELGDAIMGVSAGDFKDFKEATRDDPEAVKKYLQENVLNKYHQILVKASTD